MNNRFFEKPILNSPYGYVKNHNLGLEVPYRYGSETRKYLPALIVRVDDGHGEEIVATLSQQLMGNYSKGSPSRIGKTRDAKLASQVCQAPHQPASPCGHDL